MTMNMTQLPDKIRQLDVLIGSSVEGSLIRGSTYGFAYSQDDPQRPSVGLFMPRNELSYHDGALFPVMDQNLPEGFLFQRLREIFHKQPLTPMHLLALVGTNGIGRLGFKLQNAELPRLTHVSRNDLLRAKPEEKLFEELVNAYLSTGVGIAGMQPKIMIPDRATIPIPNLIVKAGSASYPGLAANEFICLSAAKKANINVPRFDLSDDGSMLLLDRFDLSDGELERFGFEDVAALMGLQVRDVLSNRKYHGSYENIALVFKAINLPRADLEEFFSQVAFSIMVRNGDGHLKNYGVLYTSSNDIRLSPMFDVVTTSIYRYERYAGGPPMEDNTMALKLFRGRNTKTYPLTNELLEFGSRVCGVRRPEDVINRIAQAMHETLLDFQTDSRIPDGLLDEMGVAWQKGLAYAKLELPPRQSFAAERPVG